jgi:hypothetical protein
MTMKTKNILLALGIVILLLILNTCRLSNNVDKKDKLITAEQLAKQRLDSIVSTKNQVIYRQEAIITSNQLAINQLTDSIFSLKKRDSKNRQTIAYYKGTTKVEVDSVDVPYLDTIAMKKFEDTVAKRCSSVIAYMNDSTITVPRTASLSTDTLSVDIDVTKSGVNLRNLSLVDTLQLRFVEHKGSLFRRASTEIQYFHSNPYFKNIAANSVIYKPKPKPKLLQKALFIAAGIWVGTKL